jgi:hypothetical protein
MLAGCTAATLLASSALADSTTSPGKEVAYSSINDVPVNTSFGTMTSVTILKGKRKRVLQVTIIAEADPIGCLRCPADRQWHADHGAVEIRRHGGRRDDQLRSHRSELYGKREVVAGSRTG